MAALPLLRQKIYLIGDVDTQIFGNKLPSNLQVLKVLFFNVRQLGLSMRDGAKLVIKEVLIYWEKAQIPTIRVDHCVDKLQRLYERWRGLQKNIGKASHESHESEFRSFLPNLFDIAHLKESLSMDPQKLQFLENQRMEGRVGYIADVRTFWDCDDDEIRATKKRKRNEDETDLLLSQSSTGSTLTSSQSTLSHHSADPDYKAPGFEQYGSNKSVQSRGTINIYTEKLVSTLDRCRVSSRNATRLIIAIAEALQVDAQSLIINKTSVSRYREKLRKAKAEKIREVFQTTDLNEVVLHWDGKIIQNLQTRKSAEKLPVLVTNSGTEQLLKVAELEDSTGLSQANAIFEAIEEWGLIDNIKALSFDTTASNTGRVKGAAVLLEQMMEKDLLWLPCRHHIFELVLKSVFSLKMPQSVGPNVQIFERFRSAWSNLNHTNYSFGIEDVTVEELIKNNVQDICSFIDQALQMAHPRGDYKELLNLAKIFIGKVPSQFIKFKAPGACHHARWMAKAIYSFKIFIFRKEFKLTVRETRSLAEICIFIVNVYLKAWFTAPHASKAPNHDFEFFKQLHQYQSIDLSVSQATLKKFANHAWYLSPESSAMAFFDETLSDEIKERMVAELIRPDDPEENSCKKLEINLKDVADWSVKGMDYFISPLSLNFFKRFNINTEFLKLHPSLWMEDENYLKGWNIVNKLKVVNDSSERSVSHVQRYCNTMTKDSDQEQLIYLTVAEDLKQFPNASKKSLMSESL